MVSVSTEISVDIGDFSTYPSNATRIIRVHGMIHGSSSRGVNDIALLYLPVEVSRSRILPICEEQHGFGPELYACGFGATGYNEHENKNEFPSVLQEAQFLEIRHMSPFTPLASF